MTDSHEVERATEVRIERRHEDRAFLIARCPLKGECRWPVWQRPATGTMWQWDGNVEHANVTPSIDCDGGCGRHFTVKNGVPNG